jgi:hypothetical protein
MWFYKGQVATVARPADVVQNQRDKMICGISSIAKPAKSASRSRQSQCKRDANCSAWRDERLLFIRDMYDVTYMLPFYNFEMTQVCPIARLHWDTEGEKVASRQLLTHLRATRGPTLI